MAQVQFFNFQVATRDIEGLTDARGESIKAMLKSDYSISVNSVRVILGYQVKSNISEKEAERAIYDLFADPIIEFGWPLFTPCRRSLRSNTLKQTR